jgi:hypothetical protein
MQRSTAADASPPVSRVPHRAISESTARGRWALSGVSESMPTEFGLVIVSTVIATTAVA